ncbi:hypothetical protein VIGAN_11145200 [Vigna angularis var. angularis]|uniref:Uncharacterized protein n=1 Tax=Vigna angularis var. angularis TaxID=157739 RepID=A0A0S3T9Z0_PHAAN|nr:hypothetical protein VIGAN_11145200 [Vigna angularis var. angularis]
MDENNRPTHDLLDGPKIKSPLKRGRETDRQFPLFMLTSHVIYSHVSNPNTVFVPTRSIHHVSLTHVLPLKPKLPDILPEDTQKHC